jgi:hypothetical protein
MKRPNFDKLLAFLDRLDKARIPYRMSKHIEGALSIEVYAPGEHWEVDFFADGDIYVERFRSNGHIDDETAFEELFALCSDEETPAAKDAKAGDGAARKGNRQRRSPR